MKKRLRITAALMLVTILVLSLAPTVSAAQPTTYSDTYNSGNRDTLCTSLSGTGASSYYTGIYTYDNLDDLSSSALLSRLRTLLTSTHTTTSTYDDCKDMASKTDCINGNGKVILLYTNVTSTQSAANSGWNREHVWPKSLGGYETSGPGADLHHIRPTDNRVNSCRSNLKYGYDDGKAATGGNAASGVVGGYYSSYFEPLDNAKGDVARICLYMYVRYGASYSKCSSITNVFESVDTLLEWCALDPVDTWEMGRNEVVENFQGNRNVFIDYPELAWQLFGRTAPANMSSPSGGASQGGSQGGSTCGHSSTELRNVKSATCGAAGYSGDTYCTLCGVLVRSGSVIAATSAHTWGSPVTVTPPTETQNGTARKTCSSCGATQTVTLPATGGGGTTPEQPGTGGTVTPGNTVTVSKTASEMQSSLGGEIALDGNISVEFAKGTAGTAPAYYSPAIRVYQSGGVLTVSAKNGMLMSSIVITTDASKDGNGKLSISGGSLVSNVSGVLTIAVNEGASSVVITVTGTSQSDRLYVKELAVSYAAANVSEPDEPSVPDTPTEPDEPTVPDTPDTPDEPTVPDTPSTPGEPTEPDESIITLIMGIESVEERIIILVHLGLMESVYYDIVCG